MNTRSRLCLVVAVAVAGAATASTLLAMGDRYGRDARPEEVVLEGTVVDLHSYMTGKFSSDDKAKSTRDAIRAGVPVALETDEGLVVIGMGDKGPARKLMPYGYREVELSGTLYDKDGVEYIDIESISALEGEDGNDQEERPGVMPDRVDDEDENQDEGEEDYEEEDG